MDLQKNIRDRCHVNTNDDGDSFVGVKADTDDAIIYFPIGDISYQQTMMISVSTLITYLEFWLRL